MGEMVERVAREVRLRTGQDPVVIARAAISAMWDPTEDMLLGTFGYHTSVERARMLWHAMLDRALR
jgi:hypothetical protein